MTYPAHAFHEQFAGGRSSGSLAVSAQTVTFHHAQGEVSIPVAGLHISAGGANQRLLFLEHPALPGWSFYTSDRSLLRDPQLQRALAPLLANLQTQHRHRQLVGIGLVLLLLLLPVAAFRQLPAFTAWAAARVPAEWEQQLGEKALMQYRLQHGISRNEQTQQQLQQLTAVLTEQIASPRHAFQFDISDDPAINAFALPGGYVVVNAGLIQAAETPEELLGVLAHELSHVTAQHGVRNVIASLGVIVFFQAIIGDAGGLAASIGSAVPLLLNQGYSRDFEREADEQGFALLLRANVNPAGMVAFFQRVQAEENRKMAEVVDDAEQREWLKTAQTWLGTHPSTDERISRLQQKIAREAPGSGYRQLDAEFVALKQSVEQFVAKKTTEASTAQQKNTRQQENTVQGESTHEN